MTHNQIYLNFTWFKSQSHSERRRFYVLQRNREQTKKQQITPHAFFLRTCLHACEFRLDCMGKWGSICCVLRCHEAPIKHDYDVDKVTQQTELIQPPQESSVLDGARDNALIASCCAWCQTASNKKTENIWAAAVINDLKCHIKINGQTLNRYTRWWKALHATPH